MSMAPIEDEIRGKVIAAVAAALDTRPEAIDPGASLSEELGAESLDFMDITFRLEEEFGICMPRLGILERAEEVYGEETLIRDGLITDLGLELLRRSMPEIDPGRFRPGLRALDLGRLLTAETFVRVVARLLAAKAELPATCAACGAPVVDSDTSRERVCAGCREVYPLPDGDRVLVQDFAALGL